MDFAVIPECYIDTNLIETIAPPRGKGYNHQMGCNTVAKKMKENFGDKFALGIIDNDKRRLDYLNEFDEVIKKGSLILHKHKNKHHYIIQICPDAEGFIVGNANVAGVSLSDFGLPADINALKAISKQKTSKEDIVFKKLFKRIQKAQTPDFQLLKTWIEYLRDTNYAVDINYLKSVSN